MSLYGRYDWRREEDDEIDRQERQMRVAIMRKWGWVAWFHCATCKDTRGPFLIKDREAKVYCTSCAAIK